MLNILALDQATHCGWAYGDSSGVWDFSPLKDESVGARLLRFKKKLSTFHRVRPIQLVAYERVAGQHKASIIFGSKMAAMIETFCEENKIEYRAFSATEVKKDATGKGNSGKPAMVAAAQAKYGMKGTDDNQADALHILALARKTFC